MCGDKNSETGRRTKWINKSINIKMLKCVINVSYSVWSPKTWNWHNFLSVFINCYNIHTTHTQGMKWSNKYQLSLEYSILCFCFLIYMACFRTRQNFKWNKSVFWFHIWYSIFCPICLIDLISNVSENRMHSKFIQIVKYVWWRGYLSGLLA